jgi:hypothetical protein
MSRDFSTDQNLDAKIVGGERTDLDPGAQDRGQLDVKVGGVALLVSVVEEDRVRQSHVHRGGRVDHEGPLTAHGDSDHVSRNEGRAGVPARGEDGARIHAAEAVVVRVLLCAHEVVRRARADVDRRPQEPRQHLHARSDLELRERLVGEPSADHSQERAP